MLEVVVVEVLPIRTMSEISVGAMARSATVVVAQKPPPPPAPTVKSVPQIGVPPETFKTSPELPIPNLVKYPEELR